MKRILVRTQQRIYPVVIGTDLKNRLIVEIKKIISSGQILILTHPKLNQLYGKKINASLKRAGYKVLTLALPEGEQSKSQKALFQIYETLVKNHFERNSAIVTLGGGVVGDVGGFAASTYMRGIRLIHIPTSLLAQVDSAIGGKTAIDLPQGKNLVGAFYQPHLVVCDVNTLKTLPPADLSSQLAEVIKYGVIQRPALFSYLEKNMSRLLKKDLKALEHVVSESVQIKAQVVSQDERDHAVREILNYGHTFAHAFETLGRYRSLSHGQAVALGMVAAARVAVSLKLFSPQEESRQLFLIQKAGLPVNLARFSFRASQIVEVMKHDKKVKHGQIRLVLPQRIGQVIVRPVAPLIITHILKELTCG
jgi:3-dehydroquinate synthase